MALYDTSAYLGAEIWVILCLYLAGVLVFSVLSFYASYRAHRSSRRKTNDGDGDHIVVRRYQSLGKITLIFSMIMFISTFAFVGAPEDSYSNGYLALRWLPASLFIVLGALLITSRLVKLTHIRKYESPLDFLSDRFRSMPHHMLSTLVMVVPTIAMLTIQITIVSVLLEKLSQGSLPHIWGSILFGLVVMFYNVFGSLASVAVVDILFGGAVLISFIILLIVQQTVFGGMNQVLLLLSTTIPPQAIVSIATNQLNWIFWTVPWIAVPLNPHFLSLLMAARSARGIRLGFAALTVMPFMFVVAGVIIGMCTAGSINASYYGFNRDIFSMAINVIMHQGSAAMFAGALVLCGFISAILSSVSNGMISMGSIIATDIVRPLSMGTIKSHYLLRATSIISSVVMTSGAVAMANIANLDYLSWIMLHNGIILQLLPSFIAGLYCPSVGAIPLVFGLVGGLSTMISLHFTMTAASAVPQTASAVMAIAVNILVTVGSQLMVGGLYEGDNEILIDSELENSISFESKIVMDHSATASWGKFTSPLPRELLGFRMSLKQLQLQEPVESSFSGLSEFDSAIQDKHRPGKKHTLYGSIIMGLPGQIGKITEPVHNIALLLVVFALLILTVPFNLTPPIIPGQLPNWVYYSFSSSIIAALVILCVIFTSWDVPSKTHLAKSVSISLSSLSSHSTVPVRPKLTAANLKHHTESSRREHQRGLGKPQMHPNRREMSSYGGSHVSGSNVEETVQRERENYIATHIASLQQESSKRRVKKNVKVPAAAAPVEHKKHAGKSVPTLKRKPTFEGVEASEFSFASEMPSLDYRQSSATPRDRNHSQLPKARVDHKRPSKKLVNQPKLQRGTTFDDMELGESEFSLTADLAPRGQRHSQLK